MVGHLQLPVPYLTTITYEWLEHVMVVRRTRGLAQILLLSYVAYYSNVYQGEWTTLAWT